MRVASLIAVVVKLSVTALENSLPAWTRALLGCLRVTCRQVFVLREVGWPGPRIAAELGISSQRVYALYAEATEAMAAAARRASELASVAQGRHDASTNVLDLSVRVLGVSPRAEHALARAAVTTLGELVALPRDRLSALRGVGPRSLREIERALHEMGLQLAED